MRPYKIPYTNIWVDLDTIQSIHEPALGKYENCVLRWQHAFRSDYDEVNYGRQNMVDTTKFEYGTDAYYDEKERVEKHWRQHGIDKCYREVFVPFFTAWAGVPPTKS